MKNPIYILFALAIFSSCTEEVESCIEVDKTTVTLGESIKVTDCSSNAEYTVVDYGDGSDSAEFSGPRAITYHLAGTYTITLYAYDNYGYNKKEVEVTVTNPDESQLVGKWRLNKRYNWYDDQDILFASPVVFDIKELNYYYKITKYGALDQDTLNSSFEPKSFEFNWIYSSNNAQMSIDLNDIEQTPYHPNSDNDQMYIFSITDSELVLSDKAINPRMIYSESWGTIFDYGYDNLYYFSKVD